MLLRILRPLVALIVTVVIITQLFSQITTRYAAPCEGESMFSQNNGLRMEMLSSSSSPYRALNNRSKFELALNSITPPTIYHCSNFAEGFGLIRDLLPEHKVDDKVLTNGNWHKGLKDKESSEYDIFIESYGARMSCNCNQDGLTWLFTKFKGQFIYMSGESTKYPFDKQYAYNPHRHHVFGPIFPNDEVGPSDMILTLLQIIWWDTFKPFLTPAVMTDGEFRPKGNGTYFLVYAQGNCVGFRDNAFGLLSKLGQVHQAGKCGYNNPVNITKVGDQWDVHVWNWQNNFHGKHYQNYRFCLVMEHSNEGFYVTEKIMMAFASGCIPIYYGPEDFIYSIFNKKAFVYYDINNPSSALNLVSRLEANRTMYDEMLNEPILANGNNTIEEYFSFDESIGNGLLKRRVKDKLNFP